MFSSVRESPSAGASPTRPAGICFSPIWMRPRRNVPVVRTTDAAGNLAAIGEFDAADAAILENEIVGFGFDHLEIGRCADRGLHGLRIKLAVGLGARAAHGRAFAAVQNAELDAAGVGDAAHEAVQGIDFPHQMALAEPANGRIAGHGADGRESVRHQGRFRAHAGAGSRGFTAGMAAADDDDVESRIHSGPQMGLLAEGAGRVKEIAILRNVSRETSAETGNKLPVIMRFLGPEPSIVIRPSDDAILGQPVYLPMQKSRKITSRMSSTSTRPVRRPKRAGGDAQLLGQQILAAGELRAQRPPQGRQGVLQGAPVALAGDQRRLGAGQEAFGVAGEGGQKRLEAFACGRRKIEYKFIISELIFITSC